MLANIITLSRLLFTFVVVAMFGRHHTLDITLIGLIVVIFALDAIDGIVARKHNQTSQIGEVLDTLADRIIENTFWIYFTATGLIPLWMPITVMARGFMTDTLKRTFGNYKSRWTHTVTQSRISRGLYGAVKMLTFLSLACTAVFNTPPLETVSHILATVAVGFCLLRGLPFFFIWKTSC